MVTKAQELCMPYSFESPRRINSLDKLKQDHFPQPWSRVHLTAQNHQRNKLWTLQLSHFHFPSVSDINLPIQYNVPDESRNITWNLIWLTCFFKSMLVFVCWSSVKSGGHNWNVCNWQFLPQKRKFTEFVQLKVMKPRNVTVWKALLSKSLFSIRRTRP